MRRMPAAPEFPPLPKTEIFARLAEGTGVLVTPNRRLALALKREFDDAQARAGQRAWSSADILPFGAFIERAYHEALHSAVGGDLPLLLSAAQEQQLWETVIAASEWGGALLAPAQTAAHCRTAWQLAHAWRIADRLGDGNEDTQAFAAWARAYVERCARGGHIDGARLPDLVGGLLRQNALRRPPLLVAYAFDILTPQQHDLLVACASGGGEVRRGGPAPKIAAAQRLACSGAREEFECAARWARARLDQHAAAPRIGVVVPDLEQRRRDIVHIFSRVLEAGGDASDSAVTPVFNVSLGLPLADYPLVAAALAIFDIASGTMEFAAVSSLVRSPFLDGADDEWACRARLDAVLRELAPPQLSLPKLLGAIAAAGVPCPRLAQRLDALFAYAKQNFSGTMTPQQWARHFSALLEAAGFPGDRALDSAEFQARAKFYEVLGEFARLERVASNVSYVQARTQLRRLCADTLFQPESTAAPIQVLGIFEAAGLEFDHLWVTGLTDETWPLAARPHPFLPPALQKKAGIPQAAAETSLALDRRITAGWLAAAGEVIVSHPLREQDRELLPSPLIAALPIGPWKNLQVPDYPRYRDVIHRAAALTAVPDGAAPPFAAKKSGGGTRVLVDQAACPFRAFARHRLVARALPAPQFGLDAKGRGILLHALLRTLWQQLRTRAALEAMPPDQLTALIKHAAAVAIAAVRARQPHAIEARFAQLEQQRLMKLARDWLEIETQRADFEVAALEDERELTAGGIAFRGRLDRLDRLATGGYALIDYKSGRHVTPKDWDGARPDDPQLPLYAINAPEDIAAVAFAKLRVGALRFSGFSRAVDVLPRVKTAASWDGLLAGWRREIEALGRGFAAGDARVAPKRPFKTCERCDLQPLCRVYERFSALVEEEGDTE